MNRISRITIISLFFSIIITSTIQAEEILMLDTPGHTITEIQKDTFTYEVESGSNTEIDSKSEYKRENLRENNRTNNNIDLIRIICENEEIITKLNKSNLINGIPRELFKIFNKLNGEIEISDNFSNIYRSPDGNEKTLIKITVDNLDLITEDDLTDIFIKKFSNFIYNNFELNEEDYIRLLNLYDLYYYCNANYKDEEEIFEDLYLDYRKNESKMSNEDKKVIENIEQSIIEKFLYKSEPGQPNYYHYRGNWDMGKNWRYIEDGVALKDCWALIYIPPMSNFQQGKKNWYHFNEFGNMDRDQVNTPKEIYVLAEM